MLSIGGEPLSEHNELYVRGAGTYFMAPSPISKIYKQGGISLI